MCISICWNIFRKSNLKNHKLENVYENIPIIIIDNWNLNFFKSLHLLLKGKQNLNRKIFYKISANINYSGSPASFIPSSKLLVRDSFISGTTFL